MRKTLACVVALVAAAAANAAPIQNGDFNNGLSGWFTYPGGNAGTTSANLGPGPSPSGNPYGYAFGGAVDTYQYLYTNFTANAGQWLSFDWFFSAGDYSPFNDDGFIALYDYTTGTFTYLDTASVSTVGDFGNTGWKHFNVFLPSTGTYQIQSAVTNRLDGSFASYVGLDGVRNPEPVSLLVFGGLVAGGGWLARRRMKAAA
jgi:hypothetical protein